MQSVNAAQLIPSAHRGQLLNPPQSTPVSFWFLTVSLQGGARQVQGGDAQLLFKPHTPLKQSPPQLQEREASQRGQRPTRPLQFAFTMPPQSVSDSMSLGRPFLITS